MSEELVNVEIDGVPRKARKGSMIIQITDAEGTYVPRFCYHEKLSIAANCRMCLVEVEKAPKPMPACATPVVEGMKVFTRSPRAIAAQKATMEFLLINHPLDCPICDQAGECRLQDYWLEHQRKGKRMRQEPVHKPKAVTFGPTIVYDAERCIVCTRCIRVCNELARDPVLSVRERGNLGEITVSPDRQLDHDYTLMTEHVCPVGALTSRDFRFKARVWFLRSARTVCQGCATGCNAYLDYDPRNNTPYRHRPRENMAVNTYWMCDEGMLSYRRAVEGRLLTALVGNDDASLEDALAAAKEQLSGHADDPSKVAVVLSAQHSNEDNFALYHLATTYLGATDFFVSGKPLGQGDDILISEDKNPNTRGAVQIAAATPPRPVAELLQGIASGQYAYVVALGSDLEVDAGEAQRALSRLKGVVTIAAHEGPLATAARVALPACSWAEADGTYVNRKGLAQRSERALLPQGDARPAWELIGRLGRTLGYATGWKTLAELRRAMPPGAVAGTAAAPEAVLGAAPPAHTAAATALADGSRVEPKKTEATA